MSGAHSTDGGIRPGTETNTTIVTREIIPFWRLVNDNFSSHGPLTLLKLFLHGSQRLYSKTKGEVDGSTQCRAIQRSASLSLPSLLNGQSMNDFTKTDLVVCVINFCFHDGNKS